MNDGIYEHLQNTLSSWNSAVQKVLELLTTSPQSFQGGGVWSVIVSINATLQAIGLGLLVLFFSYGVLRSTVDIHDIKRPETAIKLFLRFVIAKAMVTNGMELMLAVLNIAQGILGSVLSVGIGSMDGFTIPGEIESAISDVGFFQSMPLWAVTLLGGLAATALGFVLLMEVYGRFFKFYLFTAFSPIPLSTFAGEATQNSGKQFLRNYAVCCLEFAAIALACVVSSHLMITPTVDSSAAAVNQVWDYLTQVVFNMLLLVGTVKATEKITHELIGV